MCSGYRQAMLSLPRLVWGNFINFASTIRAIYLFLRFVLFGKHIAWDKTDHVFPTEEQLRGYRRRLGDLLLERRFLSVKDLDEAIRRQESEHKPLGTIILEMGLVQEEDLLQVLGHQLRIETREIDPGQTPQAAFEALPKSLAMKYDIYPLGFDEVNVLEVACERLLSGQVVQDLEKAVGHRIRLCLVTRSDLTFAIRRGYEGFESSDRRLKNGPPRLGAILVERNLIDKDQLAEAVREQRKRYRRLGDILLSENILSSDELQAAVAAYAAAGDTMPLGEYLVGQGIISADQLQRALVIYTSALHTEQTGYGLEIVFYPMVYLFQ